MDRPTNSKARLSLAIVAALAALTPLAFVWAPLAAADTPASDEYVLKFPGTAQNASVSPGESATASGSARSGPQQGVVGEADPPDSQLDSILTTLGSAPAALVASLTVLLALALMATSHASRPNSREAR